MVKQFTFASNFLNTRGFGVRIGAPLPAADFLVVHLRAAGSGQRAGTPSTLVAIHELAFAQRRPSNIALVADGQDALLSPAALMTQEASSVRRDPGALTVPVPGQKRTPGASRLISGEAHWGNSLLVYYHDHFLSRRVGQ